MNVLAALERAKGAPTKCIAVDKNRLADSVINRTMEIGGAVAAYASGIGDETLQVRASFSKSKLRDLRDAELDDRAQAVHREHLRRDCKAVTGGKQTREPARDVELAYFLLS